MDREYSISTCPVNVDQSEELNFNDILMMKME